MQENMAQGKRLPPPDYSESEWRNVCGLLEVICACFFAADITDDEYLRKRRGPPMPPKYPVEQNIQDQEQVGGMILTWNFGCFATVFFQYHLLTREPTYDDNSPPDIATIALPGHLPPARPTVELLMVILCCEMYFE